MPWSATATHDVVNQAPSLQDYDVYAALLTGAGATLGTLPAGVDPAAIVERHAPDPAAVSA